MKHLFTVLFSVFSIAAFSQGTNYIIGEIKIGLMAKDGKFYDYFKFVGEGIDTFQVIRLTKKKTKMDRWAIANAALGEIDLNKAVLIDKKRYSIYSPYLKTIYKAYYSDVWLVIF